MVQKRGKVIEYDEERRSLSARSLQAFVDLYLFEHTYMPSPQYRLDMNVHWDVGVNPERPPGVLDIECRGFGKSFWCSVALPSWLFVCQPYGVIERIILDSNTATLSEDRLSDIRRELVSNPRIIADWGRLLKGAEKDRSDLIRLTDGRYIRAIGKGTQIRGWHPTQIICDDLEDREESQNPLIREANEKYVNADVFGALRDDPKTKPSVIFVGTIVNDESLLEGLWSDETEKTFGWLKRRYAATLDNGEPTWPEYMDRQKLAAKRAQMRTKKHGDAIFYQEFYNIAMPAGQRAINPEDCRFLPRLPVSKANMTRIMWCDPAFSQKQTADYTAIATIGIALYGDMAGNIYLLDLERGHWGTDDGAKAFLDHYLRNRPDVCGIENVVGVSYMKRYIEKLADDQHRMVRIKLVRPKPGEDKVSRAKKVEPLFTANRVFFQDQPLHHELKQELIMLPHGEHDDMADALVHALIAAEDILNRNERKQRRIMVEQSPDYLQHTGGY